MNNTMLSPQESQWILDKRILRLTDNQEILIYPMGAERYLASVLAGHSQTGCPFKDYIQSKDLLVIPGYGNTCFLFAEAGARSVTVYDKDPVTISWIKAMKKYYHYREYSKQGEAYPSVGELLSALTRWYPPLLPLPGGKIGYSLLWCFYPKGLRRNYLLYLLDLLQRALRTKVDSGFELDKNICFYAGDIDQLLQQKSYKKFHTAFVPYLLGVKNGIEHPDDIVDFIHKIMQLVPEGTLLITPSQEAKEFGIMGPSYFVTTGFKDLINMPGLGLYLTKNYTPWFHNQGMALFVKKTLEI